MKPSIAIPRPNWAVYIDGPALRGEVADYARRHFDIDGSDLVFRPLIQAPAFGVVTKTFLYDALPVSGPAEDKADFDVRYQKKEDELSRIARLTNTHVCTGQTRHRSNRARRESAFEQKGVDVLLAVDVLRSAYGNVTDHYYIITGDSDFIPLIDQLIAMGKHVALAHPAKVSDVLLEAADEVYPIKDFWNQCLILNEDMRNKFARFDVEREYRPALEKYSEENGAIRIGLSLQQSDTWILQGHIDELIGISSGTDLRAVIALGEDHGLISSEMGRIFRKRAAL